MEDIVVKNIEFEKSPNHINKYLTHWTGRGKTEDESFDILCKIIDSKTLRSSMCDNGFEYESGKRLCNIMICFTDTPIEQSLEHCQRYNYFGISFNKEKMIACGANPVLYMAENRKKHQELLFDIKSADSSRYNYNELKELFNWKDEESNTFSWLLSITQPYKTKKVVSKGFAEYLEREWRIIRVLPSAFNGYKEDFEQEIQLKSEFIDVSNNSCYVDKDDLKERFFFYLPFDNSFVENVIVLNEKKYVGRIKKLMKDVGLKCELLITERTKLE